MAKYDLRDGYWAVPVALRSRAHLMVRHPATGRLLWCRSLPFGYKLSPAIFCRVTERVAQMLRTQLAGQGIHFLVYVDDFLVVGDTLLISMFGAYLCTARIVWVARRKRRSKVSDDDLPA